MQVQLYQQQMQMLYMGQAHAIKIHQQLDLSIMKLLSLENTNLRLLAEVAKQNLEAGNLTESANLLNQICFIEVVKYTLSDEDKKKIKEVQDG
jgi:hypothetical protein